MRNCGLRLLLRDRTVGYDFCVTRSHCGLRLLCSRSHWGLRLLCSRSHWGLRLLCYSIALWVTFFCNNQYDSSSVGKRVLTSFDPRYMRLCKTYPRYMKQYKVYQRYMRLRKVYRRYMRYVRYTQGIWDYVRYTNQLLERVCTGGNSRRRLGSYLFESISRSSHM